MTKPKTSLLGRFFQDSEGHITVGQVPNIPLGGWAICKLLAVLISQHQLKTGFGQLSSAFIFVWAYLEITKGVNYFRRLLGLIVLVMVMVSYF